MFVRQEDKIVSIEDTPEIHIDHTNWIQSVSRAGFGVGSGGGNQAGSINLYDLLAAALRQRPEYVIVGEVRGKEAFTLFQAISVGHAAMATIHAGSINELLHRVENEPMNIPRVLFQSLDVVAFQGQVQVHGKRARRVRSIVEILDVEKETKNLLTNNVFQWDPGRDEFNFTGRSFILENISRETGIPMKTLKEELKRKQRFIELMDKKNLTYYKDVSAAISSYYIDPVKATIDLEKK
jgi:flagellar protein FlaI